MNIVFRKIVSLIVITFLLSSCISGLSWQSRHYIKDSPITEENIPNIITVYKDRQKSYLIPNSNKKSLSVDVGDVCSAIGLVGIIIPIPFIPMFKIASDYKITLVSFQTNKMKEDEIFKDLKVELEVGKNKYIGELQPLYKGSTARYYKFPIKCNKFNEGKITVKGFKKDDVDIEIERDSESGYMFAVAG